MRLCNKDKERICAKKREDVAIVKRKKKRDTWIHR